MKVNSRQLMVFLSSITLLSACHNTQTLPKEESQERAKPPAQLEYLPSQSTQSASTATAAPAKVPTSTRQWHELKVKLDGTQFQGYLDGRLYLQHNLPLPVSGKVGIWSKADSVVYFDDFVLK